MSEAESQPCTIKDLEERYFLIRKRNGYYFLGGCFGFLIFAGVISWGSGQVAVEKALADSQAKKATQRLEELAAKGEAILKGLQERQAESVGFTAVASGHKNINEIAKGGLSLPDVIPPTASEILIFCFARSGTAKDGTGFVKVSTTDTNGRKTTLRLYVRAYEQQGYSFNSENFWLPYPKDRTVSAQWEGINPSDNTDAYVQIIGYR